MEYISYAKHTKRKFNTTTKLSSFSILGCISDNKPFILLVRLKKDKIPKISFRSHQLTCKKGLTVKVLQHPWSLFVSTDYRGAFNRLLGPLVGYLYLKNVHSVIDDLKSFSGEYFGYRTLLEWVGLVIAN